YSYLGFLLKLGILPVYVLTNVTAAPYFLAQERFSLVRHGVMPLVGAGLMIALLVGQVVEQTERPYSWFPWVIVGWIALVAAGAAWLAAVRPRALERAGTLLATAGADEGLPRAMAVL